MILFNGSYSTRDAVALNGFVIHVKPGRRWNRGYALPVDSPDLIQRQISSGLQFGDADDAVRVALGFLDAGPVAIAIRLDARVGQIALVVFQAFRQ